MQVTTINVTNDDATENRMKRVPESPARALIVENDIVYAKIISTTLKAHNFDVSIITSYRKARDLLERYLHPRLARQPVRRNEYHPDVFILDYHLDEGKTGLELCRQIREKSNAPIIMLTANTTTETAVACLNSGADQYIHKPFAVPDLLARIGAARRNKVQISNSIIRKVELPEVRLMTEERYLLVGNERIQLTEKECLLAELFFINLNISLSKEDICLGLYRSSNNLDSRKLDVLIGRLRKKMAPTSHQYKILTERNYGYRMIEVSNESE
jgi:DNA-binding response OmpR family regulator